MNESEHGSVPSSRSKRSKREHLVVLIQSTSSWRSMEERTKMISFMFFSHHSGRYVEKREKKIDDGHTSNKQESGQSFLLSVSSKKTASMCVWLLLPGIIGSLLLVPSSWQRRRRRRRKSDGWRRVRKREREKKVHRINQYGKERSSTKYHLFLCTEVELEYGCRQTRRENGKGESANEDKVSFEMPKQGRSDALAYCTARHLVLWLWWWLSFLFDKHKLVGIELLQGLSTRDDASSLFSFREEKATIPCW